MKYLITGAGGFVGHYMIEAVVDQEPSTLIYGAFRNDKPRFSDNKVIYNQLDLNDFEKLTRLLEELKPDYIIHLAAESSVAYSWRNPTESFRNNVNIFLNILEAVRITKTPCRILAVSSSECYGKVAPEDTPIKEDQTLNPISPYAIARVSQEMLTKLYVDNYDLDIVTSRSFNHIGPSQDIRFVIPSFISQVLDRKNKNSNEPLRCGDLTIVRDFVDVRDVVRAYILLLENGIKGEVYNICSGVGYQLKDVLDLIFKKIGHTVPTQTDPSYLRPDDNPLIIGDISRINSLTGWKPEIFLEDSLSDIIFHIEKN